MYHWLYIVQAYIQDNSLRTKLKTYECDLKMALFNQCSCSAGGEVNDMLSCAPCPPPTLTYTEFRYSAMVQSLCLVELCSIARRCNVSDPVMNEECPELTTGQSEDLQTSVCDMTCIIIIATVVSATVFITLIVTIVNLIRRKKTISQDTFDCILNEKDTSSTSNQKVERHVDAAHAGHKAPVNDITDTAEQYGL